MGTAAVVEIEVPGQRLPRCGNGFVAMQINLFILHGFPQPFDEDVVAPAALAIHADPDAVLLKHADESRAGELTALIGVHDFRRTVLQKGFLQRLDTRISRQRVGQPLSQNTTRRPIQNSGQIDESALHRDVRRIHGPDLIRAIDGEVAQEVGVDPMRLIPPAGVGFAVEGFNTPLLHQRADVFASDRDLFQPEHAAQHARPGKRMLQMQLVDLPHQLKIAFRHWLRLVIRRRP